MAFPYSHQAEIFSAASLSTSGSSVSTSILEKLESNSKDRSFSPRLLVSRPPPSPKSTESFILPMPPSVSVFAIPHLPNSKSSRSHSLRSRTVAQSESTSSLVRPKSAPLLQHEWVRSANMGSSGPAPTSVHSVYRYQRSQLQPDPSSLPPATRPGLHSNWLRTDAEKEHAKEERSSLLGASGNCLRIAEVIRENVGDGAISIGHENPAIKIRNLKETAISGLPSESEQFITVFSVRTQKFRRALRSTVFTSGDKNPISELPDDIKLSNWLPPLLVDGRMTIDEIPRWNRKMMIHWRSWDGKSARLYHKLVNIPAWLWAERNLSWHGKGKEMNVFIERG